MKRRDFLRGLSFAAMLILDSPASASDDLLSPALDRARRAGKPLMVLLASADEVRRDAVGWRVGLCLNEARGAALATYGLCDWICLPTELVQRRHPKLSANADLVLIETDNPKPDLTPLTLSRWEPMPMSAPEPKRAQHRHQMVSALGDLLQRALWGPPARQQRRLAQLKNLGLDAVPLAEMSTDDAFARASWVLASHDTAATKLLAEAVEENLRHGHIPGTRWANSSYCLVETEDAPAQAPESEATLASDVPPLHIQNHPRPMACGLGMVHEEGLRFLMLYVDAR